MQAFVQLKVTYVEVDHLNLVKLVDESKKEFVGFNIGYLVPQDLQVSNLKKVRVSDETETVLL